MIVLPGNECYRVACVHFFSLLSSALLSRRSQVLMYAACLSDTMRAHHFIVLLLVFLCSSVGCLIRDEIPAADLYFPT